MVGSHEDEGQVRSTRERLASELQRLRALSGLSGRDLALQLGISQSKVSRIESGTAMPSLPEVNRWAAAMAVSEETTRQLVALTEAAFTEVSAWRTALRDRPHLQDEVLDRENRTQRSQTFQPSVVPGLLQTAEYARRVFSLFNEIPYSDEEIAEAVAGRLNRQLALYQEERRFEFLITEAALRWRPGPPRLLMAQLDRVASLSTLENVRVGVIPSDAEALAYTSHGFVIAHGGDEDQSRVTVEAIHAKLSVTGPEDVELYQRRWALLSQMALFGGDARTFLARLGNSMREEET